MVRRRKKYRHIYFESKKPGRDSVFQAVKDVGRKGLNTRKEFVRLCMSQLADLADLKTKNKQGQVIPFTLQLWSQRCFILRQLNKRKGFRLGRLVDYIDRVGRAYLAKKIGPVQLAEALDKIAKKYGVSVKEAREIARKVTQQKKVVRVLIKHIDGRIEEVILGVAKKKGVSKKEALRRARRLGKHVAKRLRSRFDEETKRIANYLWDMIPRKYKRKPLRIWYYVMVLWLAYYIRKYCREKGMDWRAIDWASEIDWRQGYGYAKEYILSMLRTTLDRYEELSERDIDEMMKYYERQAAILAQYHR